MTATECGCATDRVVRGLCMRHYNQLQREGRRWPAGAEIVDGLRRSDWEKIDKQSGGCWLWTASHNKYGYGRVVGSDGVHRNAHRYVWLMLRGPLGPDLHLDHLCRVRNCVNPDHMEPVTPGENVRRGVSGAADNARRTCCPRGHAYDRVVRRSDGRTARACRECDRIACREYRRRKAAS